ncbi:MAG: hypothetical protein HUU17_13455 [Chthonomonadales bacterium]|nr:hypothetical protein [Chthonomonadales bacterium]
MHSTSSRAGSIERMFSVTASDGSLIVQRRGGPFRKRYAVLIALLVIVLGLLIAYLAASRLNPWFWLLVVLVLLMLLALAERAYRMFQATKTESFVFSKSAGTIERNGTVVGEVREVEAVLFREVFDNERPLNEYAVVVSYENTRRLLIAESHGIPGEREQLEEIAAAVSKFLDAPIRNEPRQANEWWIDRS